MEGFEPSSLAAHAPEACVFANFTTSALESEINLRLAPPQIRKIYLFKAFFNSSIRGVKIGS